MLDFFPWAIIFFVSVLVHEYAHLFTGRFLGCCKGGIKRIGFSVGVEPVRSLPLNQVLFYASGLIMQNAFILWASWFMQLGNLEIILSLFLALIMSVQDLVALFLFSVVSKEKDFWKKEGLLQVSWQ
jgi:hypothetical protein